MTAAVADLTTKITIGAGTKHSVQSGATSRVLGLMAVEGLLIRGRPTGDWTSRRYRWYRRDRWWAGTVPPAQTTLRNEGDELEAAFELLQHWIGRFGPATVADMKWWTGWTMTKTRKILAAIDTVPVGLDGEQAGEVGYLLADDAEQVADAEPWARLLPALDPTAMGWKERDWYLGPHKAELFDRNGNIGPTIWVDGRIVGGWSQRANGEVIAGLLEPVGADHRSLIDAEVERVTKFVGPIVIDPSFPTPLQKRLSAQ